MITNPHGSQHRRRVDLAALRGNFRRFAVSCRPAVRRRRRPPGIIAVVKANAYGHGSPPVALALEQAGATMLACADIEEGVVLRQAGVRVPILVFGALSVSDLDGLFECALTPTISTPGAARAVQAAAARRRATIGYHLKIDTGMNRLGFRHDNLDRTVPELTASPNLRLDAVYTHFASADVPDSALVDEQRARFERALATGSGCERRLNGTVAKPARRARGQQRRAAARLARLVRRREAGPAALRHLPPPMASTIPLVPVMSLSSRVVAVKGLRPGEGVGYGWRFQTESRVRLPWCPPVTRMASTRGSRAAGTCSFEDDARRSWAPCRWT